MASAVCPIWGVPATLLETAGDYEVLDSPKAGGKYWISGTARAEVLPFNDRVKRSLTTWLCEQRSAGVDTPKIQSGVLDIIKSRRPLSVPSRLTAALLYLGNGITELGGYLAIGGADDDTLRCSAHTESKSLRELYELYSMLRDVGLVEGQFSLGGACHVRPTAAGWQELDNLTRRKSDSSQAFIAMWFHDSMDDAFTKGITPAVLATGYKPIRIDKKEHNNKIDDETIAEIRRSQFLIADFTCENRKVRGGVYYEAGFAQGLGIPVIWTCRDTSIDDLHFDTRQFAHLVWKTPMDLFEQLKNRIAATIGDGPLPKT